MKGISIEERAVELAHYIISTKDTVRGAALKFGISKSTVHKDVSDRLLKINPSLAHEVREILDENKAERHIRGGLATKLKYSHQKEQKEKIKNLEKNNNYAQSSNK
ncbi:MAG: sporulation transcriptional regulator SpoIIID [Clostridia bacterium]|nr:sporulation transcriptional regulator SpoIIID [Clostridia bacterium]